MNFVVQGTSQTEQKKIQQLFQDTEKDINKKLPHSVFMDIIATNPKHQFRQDLDYLDPRCEEIIKDCQVQFLKDHLHKREQFIVNEDKTHAAFQEVYSLELLKKALEPIIKEKDPSLMLLQYFENQVIEHPIRYKYFEEKGLEKSEAFACALALSFYTGYAGYGTHTSSRTNRGASVFARTCNMDASSSHSKDYFPIMHYLLKTLSSIPYHWGPCIRHVDITSDEQKRYQVGSIVSWIQFTSSTLKPSVSHFQNRNTVLHIFSLTGRYIAPFSNFPGEEEVLFPPWCTFMVTKKELGEDGKTHIYVRQVELGTTQKTILWVDDKIMDDNWENKVLMEYLTSQGLKKNLKIIPKISTNLALSFIDSQFGRFIQTYIPKEDFQIVTDMSRPDEKNGSEAGAILIKELRLRGFTQKFTVYTFNKNNASNALVKHAGNLLQGVSNYAIITKQIEFLKFITSKDVQIPKGVKKGLSHSGFMDIIAINPKHQNRQALKYREAECEKIIEDCELQFLQDHIDKKKQSLVSQDNTSLIFQKQYSLELLIETLKPIIEERDPSLMLLQYFKDQVQENPKRQEYFVQRGLGKSDAFACALALSFYSGYAGYGAHSSYRTNRDLRKWARVASTGVSSTEAIRYYLLKALAQIPDYSGECFRCLELTEDEQKLYQVGSIVSWIRFSSSNKVLSGDVSHSQINTVLHIFSITGKLIEPFSNFPGEKEVLHLPWCYFLVVKKEQRDGRTHIYVRQVKV